VVFLVLYIVFIVKGMKAGNAAIRGTSPAAPITQMAAGAEPPGLKCPHCGSVDFQPLGAKGYKGRLVANIILGWLVSRILEGKIGNTVVYHCNNCKTKWEAAPAPAGNGERLEQPCKIEVTRPGNFVGAIVGQFVYLNGEKIGRLDSGKTVAFSTSYRNNILFITDMTGTAFKEFRRFEAKPGEHIAFNFNRKFL
jgi:DNA-directed RNA polymerase subunit RPC12/RpoP